MTSSIEHSGKPSISTARRRVLVPFEQLRERMPLLAAATAAAGMSWWQVEGVDPSFRPERVLAMQVGAPTSMASAPRADFYRRVLERIESLPDVERPGFISDAFISSTPERTLTTEGDGEAVSARLRFRSDEVSRGLFQALGTRLLAGRLFSSRDGPESPRVTIVNDAMARRLWPGRDAVGRRFKLGPADSASPWFIVVGVVDDMRRQGLEREPAPQIFEPVAQNPSAAGFLFIRTERENPLDMAATVQAAVRQVDRRAPLYGVSTLESRLGAFFAPRRFRTLIVVGFAAVALLMAAIGIYGLIHYAVSTRTKEIAIRMAIGADTRHIFRMVVGEGLTLSAAGVALGLVGGVWVGWAARNLLFRRGRPGSGELHRRCGAAALRGPGCVLPSRTPRDAGRADSCAAPGLMAIGWLPRPAETGKETAMWRQVYVRLRSLWRWRRQEAELDEEIGFHLAEETDERIARGLSPEDARLAARRDFGNLTRIRELTRETWGWGPPSDSSRTFAARCG